MRAIAEKIVASEREDRRKNGTTTIMSDRDLIKQIFYSAKVALYGTGNSEIFSRIANLEVRVNPLLRGTEKATPDEVEVIKIAIKLASVRVEVTEGHETLSIHNCG